MADCPNREKNREKCACTNVTCSHHGICCECIANHREGGSLPACAREVAEKKQ